MADQKYEVAFKSRLSVLSTPLPWAPLFQRWKNKKVYETKREAEDSVRKIHCHDRLRIEIKKDYLVNLLVFESGPKWGAHEVDKWRDYDNNHLLYPYLYFRIRPV